MHTYFNHEHSIKIILNLGVQVLENSVQKLVSSVDLIKKTWFGWYRLFAPVFQSLAWDVNNIGNSYNFETGLKSTKREKNSQSMRYYSKSLMQITLCISIYLSIYLLSINLSIYLSIYLSIGRHHRQAQRGRAISWKHRLRH